MDPGCVPIRMAEVFLKCWRDEIVGAMLRLYLLPPDSSATRYLHAQAGVL